jgi:hypothetical protein
MIIRNAKEVQNMNGITCKGILKVHKNFVLPRYMQCKLKGNYSSKDYQARSRDSVKQRDKCTFLNSGQNSHHKGPIMVAKQLKTSSI